MHPIALLHKIFLEEHTLESYSNEIEQCYTTHRITIKRDVLQFLPIISKLPPMFEHGFVPLIMYLCNMHPPPPPPR